MIDNGDVNTGTGRNESESRLVVDGAGLVMTNRFTDIEPLYRSVRGYAALYRAQRMGKWHVLKCLKADYIDNPLYIGLLHKEFEIGYRLSHPNIAQTIGFERVDGLGPCIVMEYVEGRTLRSVLDGGKLTRDDARRVLLQVCDALVYIHERQVIHRDLKPENIMLTANGGNVKLIDFGYSDADSYAVLKQPAGTRRYASPEQESGGHVDARTDIYALGVIMGEINGALPHKWLRLGRVAARCTRTDADRRYALAAEVGKALAAWHAGRRAVLAASVALVVAVTALFALQPVGKGAMTERPATASQAARTVDTVYVRQAVEPTVAVATDTVHKSVITERAINNFNQDERLAALNKFAKEKTLAMLRADERILTDSSVPQKQKNELQNIQFIKIEDVVRAEIKRVVDPSSPEFSLYQSAVLRVMQETYKDYQEQKYKWRTRYAK